MSGKQIWLLAGLMMMFGGLVSGVEGADERPNILFLLADDQRADTIGAHGNALIKTPAIDSLVKEGISFRNNYCFGSNSGAVCVPSRAMINSGKVWFKVNSRLTGVRILPEILRNAGYETFGTGKWHNGENAWMRGFTKGKNIFFGGMSDHLKVPLKDLKSNGKLPKKPRFVEKSFSSELFADAAVDFIKNHKRGKPFFCYVPFTAPHDPRNPPVKYRQMYYKNRPPLPVNFLPQHPFNNGFVSGRDEILGGWPRTEKMIRDQLAEYYGLITHMDDQIGRILKALRDSPHAKNTIVIYAADHGLAMGSHGLLGKQSVYEHSMKCPLVISGPGVPKGKSSEAFTYLHDLFPTLLKFANLTPPHEIDGIALQDVISGRKTKVRDTVFLPYLKFQRSLRDERYKLIAYPQINHLQLFDLKNDPHEMKNLANDKKHEGRIREMLAQMKEWQKDVGDKIVLPTKSLPYPPLDLTGRKRRADRHQPEWIRKKYFEQD